MITQNTQTVRRRAAAASLLVAVLIPVAACTKDDKPTEGGGGVATSQTSDAKAQASSEGTETSSAMPSSDPTTDGSDGGSTSSTGALGGGSTSSTGALGGGATSSSAGGFVVGGGSDPDSDYCKSIRGLNAHMKDITASATSNDAAVMARIGKEIVPDVRAIETAAPNSDAKEVWGIMAQGFELVAKGDKEGMNKLDNSAALKQKSDTVEKDVKSRCGLDLAKLAD